MFKNFLLSPTIFTNPNLVQTSTTTDIVDPEENIVATQLPTPAQTEEIVETEEVEVEQPVQDPTAKSEPFLPVIPLNAEDMIQILSGTKVIINRTIRRFADGNHVMPNGSVVSVRYLGEATVNPKTDIVTITNKETGLTTTRTLNQFAKAEGYNDAADFKKRSILSRSLINGTGSRSIFQIAPTGSTSTVEEGLDSNPPMGTISSQANPEITEFNTYLAENDNVFPKEFNASNGRRYLLNDNNLYDLVSPDGKTMYLRNINLETGKVENILEPTIPVSDERKNQAIKDINEIMKIMDLDLIMAEDGYNIYQMMEDINNATTLSEVEKIEEIIRKYTC